MRKLCYFGTPIHRSPIKRAVQGTSVDYEFTLNEYDQPVAEFSMGFETLGHWLSEEVGDNQHRIEELLRIIQQLEQHRLNSHELFGKNFHGHINQDEVKIFSLALDGTVDEELPENTQLYDDELSAACGLQDFKHALLNWQAFVTQ